MRKELTKRLVTPTRSDWMITASNATMRIFCIPKSWIMVLSVTRPSMRESRATFPNASPLSPPTLCTAAPISACRCRAAGPYLHEAILRRITQRNILAIKIICIEGRWYFFWRRAKSSLQSVITGVNFSVSIWRIFARISSLRRFR